jgi:hypothetical protein
MMVRTERRGRERRQFPRFPAVNLTAEIDGRIFEVKDISMGGIRLSAVGLPPGTSLTFTLCPCDGASSAPAVKASGVLVGQYGDSAALKFQRPTMPLLKLVCRQAAVNLGVEPFLVK